MAKVRGLNGGGGGGARLLALLVIEQAKRDLENPLLTHYSYEKVYLKDNARKFLSGAQGHRGVLEGWCEWAEVNVNRVKELCDGCPS